MAGETSAFAISALPCRMPSTMPFRSAAWATARRTCGSSQGALEVSKASDTTERSAV